MAAYPAYQKCLAVTLAFCVIAASVPANGAEVKVPDWNKANKEEQAKIEKLFLDKKLIKQDDKIVGVSERPATESNPECVKACDAAAVAAGAACAGLVVTIFGGIACYGGVAAVHQLCVSRC